jgi:ABC-type iron transport system FetAB ATPase subunit
MKTKSLQLTVSLLVVITVLAFSSCGRSKAKKSDSAIDSATEKVLLFNGKDLNNWAFHLKDPSVDPSRVFTVQNDVIHIAVIPSDI